MGTSPVALSELTIVGLRGGDAGDSDDAIAVDLDLGTVTNGSEWRALVRRDRVRHLLARTGATLVEDEGIWDGSVFGDGNGGTVELINGNIVGDGLNRRGLAVPRADG